MSNQEKGGERERRRGKRKREGGGRGARLGAVKWLSGKGHLLFNHEG